MKILITGSSGYIGSCCYEFLKKKHIVFGLDKNENILKKQKNFFKTNISKYQNLKKIIKIKKPVICELIMDHNQEQMPKAINRRLPNGKTEATVFEDMHPFLKKEELLEASYANFIKEKKNE